MQRKIIDAVNFLNENFTTNQIEELRKVKVINPRVYLALQTKRCFDSLTTEPIKARYQLTAEKMCLNERFVHRLLNE